MSKGRYFGSHRNARPGNGLAVLACKTARDSPIMERVAAAPSSHRRWRKKPSGATRITPQISPRLKLSDPLFDVIFPELSHINFNTFSKRTWWKTSPEAGKNEPDAVAENKLPMAIWRGSRLMVIVVSVVFRVVAGVLNWMAQGWILAQVPTGQVISNFNLY
jgi:hypothetical protein